MKKIFFKILVAIAVSIMFASCSYPEDNTSDNNGTSNNGGTSSSSGGTTAAVQSITILNNTGYSIGGVWIKPSNSTEWGSNRAGSISNEQSRVFNFSQPLVAGAYDIRLRQNSSSGNIFIKYKVALSNAVIVTFEASDLTDESNHPTINIQNRTGVSFNSIYIKPSSESDWGADYGSLSNNSDKAVTIPIPSSSYTTFDVQMRSSNPANTYTKSVTISNDIVLTYTSADSDNPLTTSPIIVIENNTGYSIGGIWIKPSNSTEWGSNRAGSISNGQSRTFALSEPLLANSECDIRLRQNSSSGNIFIKYRVTISDGMIVAFVINDLTDENDHPTINIQNRTGVSFNSIYIKPSSESDWGADYGSLSNNSDKAVTIPIPSSSYTTFDVQMRSSNPANTYTKSVTISNGIVLTYTSADSDNSLTTLPIIVIENNTGYSIGGVWISPSSSTEWGSNRAGSISNGQSRTFTLSEPLSVNNVYDIRLRQNASSGNIFVKYSITMSEGMIVTFTDSDLE